jgi:hypothetical protein
MRRITYRGQLVALVVNGDLAVFSPEVEALAASEPLFRFAAAMCRLAMGLELGLDAGPYDEERAEAYARELLMPEDGFAALATLPDAYLAACFGVPADQVPERRAELGLAPLASGGGCRPG